MDTIYVGSTRKYLAVMSTDTRRRITQAKRADAHKIANLPATIALRQRPSTDNHTSIQSRVESVTFTAVSVRDSNV